MFYRLKYTVNAFWPVLAAALLLCACENDMKKIKEISDKQVNSPVDTTKGVEVIFSDSAKVKTKITAPLMLHYEVQKPYSTMPKSVKIVAYDANLNIVNTITADSATYFEGNKVVVELSKNVVAVNNQGDTFRSEQLIWDQSNNKVTSNKPVTITKKDGTVINGASLVTNDKFDPWDIPQTSGIIHVNQNITP